MARRFRLWSIVLVAVAHAIFFINYQRPDWTTFWTDQTGYLRLGRALAETGRFTRFPYHSSFVPEALRTPAYPAFVAVLDRLFGESHLVIALAHAILFAIICLCVFAMTKQAAGLPRRSSPEARAEAGEGVAWAAGLATALYPPIPYYGALVLTEVFTTFLVTLGMLVWLKALRTGAIRWFVLAGLVFGCTALTRPIFQFLPLMLVLPVWIFVRHGAAAGSVSEKSEWLERVRGRRGSVAMLTVFVAVLIPWLVYNVMNFHRLTFTPAGGVGRVLWEGSWQVQLPGRVQAKLTSLADQTWDRPVLDAKVRALAEESRLPAEPMLEFVHQWQDIRRIWDEPQEPFERTFARIAADREYGRVGLENIRKHPLRHTWRRLTRGAVLLWAAEIPVRYSDINALPPMVITGMWVVQIGLMIAAVAGLVVMWRHGARTEALAFGALLMYMNAVQLPLYSEARYSLPVKPVVVLLATVAIVEVWRGRRSPAAVTVL